MLKTLAARLALATTGSLLATGALATPALADGELDQSAAFAGTGFYGGLNQNYSRAQVFTAGLTGELTTVELGIATSSQSGKNLTVEITETSGGLPSGPALATEILDASALSSMEQGKQGLYTVNFASPAQIESGSTYAITVATTDSSDNYNWYYAKEYAGGEGVGNNSGSGWTSLSPSVDMTFATYVLVPSPSNTSGGGSQPARAITLALRLPAGVQCSSSSLTTSGPWIELPSAGDCSISDLASDTNPLLLGWATQAGFPVDIAQRQVDNGWGAYETFNDDGQLTGVFIPAGGYTAITGDTNLYPIWSE